MAKTLSGFVDNGKGAPLPGISAIVTRVTDGGIVTSGLTDSDGEWLFTGLAETDEYFVNLADGSGNAIVRGPWSGELRTAWIRDRLALPDTGLAVLPNGGNTTVGGLPLVLDPNPANVLEWGASGLFSAGSVGLTQALADTLYEPIDSAYTKAESDALYAPAGGTIDAYTKAESDARYAELTDVDPFPQYLTPAEANALYEPFDSAYTKSEADARYTQGGITQAAADLRYEPLDSAYTKSEADARYEPLDSAYTKAEDDARFVNLAGGSVMTGLLGPSTHNTRDLGTTGTRWRALYGMTGDLTTSLTVATKPVAISPDAANIVEWRSNGFYAAAGAVSDIWVNTTGDTMTGDLNMTANVLPTVTNVRSLGSTSLRWLKVWATDADFTNAPTVGGSALLTSTAADALFLTPTEGNAAYVGLAGGSVMTGLLGPTTTNTRDLGTTALRWRKLYVVDADLSGALAVTGNTVLTGTLTAGQTGISSGATISGGLNVTTGGATISPTLSVNSRPVIMAGCRAYHSANQSVATTAYFTLAFNSERYDTDAFHDLVTNNSRLTVPAGLAGTYQITVNLTWAPIADTTYREVNLYLNGTTQIAVESRTNFSNASFSTTVSLTTEYVLAVGDYVQVRVYHLSAAALNVLAAGNYSPEFSMRRVG